MVKVEHLKNAKALLKRNTDHKQYHMTSDGNCFPKLNDAALHKTKLSDKAITVVDRENVNDMIKAAAEAEKEGRNPQAPAPSEGAEDEDK